MFGNLGYRPRTPKTTHHLVILIASAKLSPTQPEVIFVGIQLAGCGDCMSRTMKT